MDVHYDNPDKLTGLKDSSGLRLYYTMTSRKHKASLITIGQSSRPNSLFLAPGEKSIAISNLCPSECTDAVRLLFLIAQTVIAGYT
eukprot:m.77733 g.77733  ORF g.77733 m.77733 type:complete len:86 (+) comp36065_c0_seq6:482-739(+)